MSREELLNEEIEWFLKRYDFNIKSNISYNNLTV
jgi:Ca2+-binding EF-hand superfamily protein